MEKLNESLLKNLPPFDDLEPGQLREVLDQSRPHRFDKGSTVFEEGEQADQFYFLLDGYIRVVRHTKDGDQVIVLHIPSSQLFGIAQAFGRSNYPATAIAVSECLTLSWPSRLWPIFNAHYTGFAATAMHAVGVRIEEFNDRIVEMATLQVEQRVAHVLLRLINQTGRKTDRGIEIDFPITRQDLSEMTGSTLHTISRLLSGWDKIGIIESGRKRILVRDPHQLVILSSGQT